MFAGRTATKAELMRARMRKHGLGREKRHARMAWTVARMLANYCAQAQIVQVVKRLVALEN
jgi:hypothetical protein